MNAELIALDALDQLKRAAEKVRKTYVSHYLQQKLQTLIDEIEHEIDLRDDQPVD